MQETEKGKIRALRNALRSIDGNGKEKCTICRLVLIFAFVVFLTVLIFVFFLREKPDDILRPLPPELAPRVDPATREREILEVAKIFHPEIQLPSSAPATTSPAATTTPK